MKQPVVNDTSFIAACGLYCAACGKFRNSKCPGCAGNEKASWCHIRTCCITKGIANCSFCKEFSDPKDCKKYNTLIARAFGLIFRSDRAQCINFLRENDAETFSIFMAEKEWISFPKKK